MARVSCHSRTARDVELEVFHNPLAARPIPFDLIPGATHWFERDGEIKCSVSIITVFHSVPPETRF
jgi:hypothetical protein